MIYIYFWLITQISNLIPTHKETLTCRNCGRIMNVVWVDEIDCVMSPEFNSREEIVNFLGKFPDYSRGIGVSEQGYFDFVCKLGCYFRYADNFEINDYFFSVTSALENLNRYRTGKHNLSLTASRHITFALDDDMEQGELF